MKMTRPDESWMSTRPKHRRAREARLPPSRRDGICAEWACRPKPNEGHLYQTENRGELVGNVRLRDKGMLIVGDRAEL